MSKRVANKKGKSRKTPARSRVRLGWKRKRQAQIDAMIKELGHEEGM